MDNKQAKEIINIYLNAKNNEYGNNGLFVEEQELENAQYVMNKLFNVLDEIINELNQTKEEYKIRWGGDISIGLDKAIEVIEKHKKEIELL